MTRVTGNTTVEFDGSQFAKVLVELEPGTSFNLALKVRVYPAAAKPVVSTPKQAYFQNLGNRQETITEDVKFEDSVTAETSYPIAAISSVESLDNFMFTVDPVTKEAEDVSVRFAYTGNTTRLRAVDSSGRSVKVTGVATVSYTTDYSLWDYRPHTSTVAGVTTTEYGSVYAYYLGAVGSLDIAAESATGLRYTELYRVFSLVAIDGTYKPESVWHYPFNWPKVGSNSQADLPEPTYGGLIATSGPDPDASLIQRRVFEVGYVNPRGYEDVKSFTHPPARPFSNHSSTQFYWSYEEALPAGYEEAQRNISKTRIRERLESDYSRLIET